MGWPGVGFTALVITSITTSTHVAAATIATSLSATKAGFWAKFIILFGGVLSGLFLGIMGVILGTKRNIDKIADKETLEKTTDWS